MLNGLCLPPDGAVDRRRDVRVVVGTDGSKASEVARRLVESIGWPTGTQFVFVTAYGGQSMRRPHLLQDLDVRADPLRKAGYFVEVRAEPGHAGQVLRRLAAD